MEIVLLNMFFKDYKLHFKHKYQLVKIGKQTTFNFESKGTFFKCRNFGHHIIASFLCLASRQGT
jgi:hypothetical protein